MYRRILTKVLTWRYLPLISGSLVIITALLVLTGWAVHSHLLRSSALSPLEMKPNTAISLLFTAIAFLLLLFKKKPAVILARFLLTIPFLVGFVTLLEYLLGTDWGIDVLLIRTGNETVLTADPVRMAINSAFSFLLSSYILISISLGREYTLRIITQVFNSILFSFGAIGLIGYIFGLHDLIALTGYSNMSVNTSLAFFILSIGMASQIQKTIKTEVTTNQVLLWILSIIGMIILFMILISSLIVSMQKESDRTLKGTWAVENKLRQLEREINRSEISLKDFMLTGNEEYSVHLDESHKAIRQILSDLIQTKKNNFEQSEHLARLQYLIEERMMVSDSILAAEMPVKSAGDHFIALNRKFNILNNSLHALIPHIMNMEEELLNLRQEENMVYLGKERKLMTVAIVFQIILLFVILFVVYSDIIGRRSAMRQLNELNRNLENKVRARTESLEKSERRFRTTMDNMMEGCQIIDFEYRYRYINISAARQGKLPQEEYIGKKMEDLFPGIEQTPLFGNIRKVLEKRVHLEIENEFIYPGGMIGYFLLRLEPVEEGVFILSSDITQQKIAARDLEKYRNHLEQLVAERTAELESAAERIQDLYENAPCGYHSLDNNGTIVVINNTELEWLGYTREELIGKKSFLELLTPESQQTFKENFPVFLKNGVISDIELEVIRKDGSTFFISVNGRAIYDSKGNFIMSRSSLFDITGRKDAESAMMEAIKVAEEANRAKSLFLANMSHEIRTPMNAVLGYAELMKTGIRDPRMTEYLDSVMSSGKSLLTLINDILDLSKIEAGKAELILRFVTTRNFFGELVKVFSLKAKQKGLDLVFVMEAETPESICIDEGKLRQVIFNLIGNALKYTEEGSITIRIRVENKRVISYEYRQDDELADLLIEIQDTGIGIDEAQQSMIFDPFYQIRDSSHLGGTGLGLNISRRLIQLMKGYISLKSAPGKGSTFSLFIPDVLFRNSPVTESPAAAIDPEIIRFRPSDLLVVDDIPFNRKYILDALHNSGIRVQEAESAEIALEKLQNEIPDLIIADIRMQGMDGFSFLDLIRKNEKLKHIPVIAYSASVMKEQQDRILQGDFAGMLIKPVNVISLYTELIKHLPYSVDQPARKVQQKTEVEGQRSQASEKGKPLGRKNKTELLKIWDGFKVRQPIQEIESFGNKLQDLGKTYHQEILKEYGEKLVNAANDFNIEVIMKLIKEFPALISEL
ncbi:MAG: ATP-binding protein [Bacteroidota bacterium]